MMPYPDEKKTDERMGWKVYKDVFVSFFSKPGVVPAMVFFLFYRLGESAAKGGNSFPRSIPAAPGNRSYLGTVRIILRYGRNA